MSKQPLLSESTQKRLLLLAGMSHFSDEVINESKKDGIPTEPDYMGGEKSLKPASGGKKTENAKDPKCDDKKKLNEEIPQDDTMAPAPVSPTPEAAPPALPPVEGASDPAATSASVDLKGFAKYLADYFKSQGHEITFTVDGEDVAQDPASEDEFGATEPEAEFGGEPEAEFGGEEAPAPEPEPEEASQEPKFESKEKQVAKLVYEEVIRTLTANAGINLDQAKKVGKVQVKLADKAKTTKK